MFLFLAAPVFAFGCFFHGSLISTPFAFSTSEGTISPIT